MAIISWPAAETITSCGFTRFYVELNCIVFIKHVISCNNVIGDVFARRDVYGMYLLLQRISNEQLFNYKLSFIL